MDKNTLTAEKIEAGKLLLSKLDQGKFAISAAFWLNEPTKSPAWKLYLASSSPDIDIKDDPLKARQLLSDMLKPSPLTLDDIQLIPLDHPFITNIAQSIQTGPGISNMRLSKSQFDKIYIEDLYLYRLYRK